MPLKIILGNFVTPQEIWKAYGVPSGTKTTSSFSSQSVAEFLGQFYDPKDLQMFFSSFGERDQNSLVTVVGPNNATQPGGEASLDIQYLMGVAQNTSTFFWSLTDLHDGQEPFLEWITNVLAAPNPPFVHSISYGDDESSLTQDYMQRVNTEFQKAGLQGVSLLFSSGDNGVFGGGSFDCPKFSPSFPASSPFVTAVGATLFSTQYLEYCNGVVYGVPINCHIVGETTSSTTAGSRITSGGGFSNVFSTPDYQASAVQQYAPSISDIPASYYNSKGRAYPDVSALGHNYLVALAGTLVPIDGTSASAPTFAAIVTLLNDMRFNLGKSPLGFLNPLLYQISDEFPVAFNDVTTGSNECSEVSWICCDYGFTAAVGYDAVTGLGSPKYDILVELVSDIP